MKLSKIKSYILVTLVFLSFSAAGVGGSKQQPPAKANVEVQQHKPTPIFSWLDWFNFS